jgi:hypothetical protein
MRNHSADQHCKAGSAPSSSKQNSGSRTWTEIQRMYASQQTSHIEATLLARCCLTLLAPNNLQAGPGSCGRAPHTSWQGVCQGEQGVCACQLLSTPAASWLCVLLCQGPECMTFAAWPVLVPWLVPHMGWTHYDARTCLHV